MSKVQASSSVYGTDSSVNYSELPLSSEGSVKGSSLYSCGSSIDITSVQSEAETSNSAIENVSSISAKTDSIKSLWSSGDPSACKGDDISASRPSKQFVPNDASPFIYDGHVIRYNTERGVNYDTPVIFGSKKTHDNGTKHGYRASHCIFDPKLGTLAAGYDVNNGWKTLPNFSLISGIGNLSELDACLLSGSYNKILLELLPNQDNNCSEAYCVSPSSCAIIGGTNNIITNNSPSQFSSTIIASSGMRVNNCNETVILGMKSRIGEAPISNLNESTVTRNLYGLERIHAGHLDNEILPLGTVLHVNGDALFSGDLNVKGSFTSEVSDLTVQNAEVRNLLKTDIFYANAVHTEKASVVSLEARHIAQYDRYVKGIGQTGTTGPSGQTGPSLVIKDGDGVNVVYANPIAGSVYIQLGTPEDSTFERNRTIVIKDVTLEFGATSSNNVIVYIPSLGQSGPTAGQGPYPQPGLVQMEFYNQTTMGLSVANNATAPVGYVLNTVNGSVTLRYAAALEPGALSTWVIENQFLGNPRALSTTGLTFSPASAGTRTKLIRK